MTPKEPRRATKMFYTTGEACSRLGIPPHTIRYWERRLELSFARTKGGRRLFRKEDIDLLSKIMKYMEEGYALKGAKRIIKGMSQMELPLDSSSSSLKKAVRKIRRELADLLDELK